MRIRLDKYLSDMGIGTRQEVKRHIRSGAVTVDGEVMKSPDKKVEIGRCQVCFQGNPVIYQPFEYYMLNKPAGVVCASKDKREKTVMELIACSRSKGLFPAGRLDKDTEGLLLVTNDGALAHRLLSPKNHVDKVYYAKVKGNVTEETVKRFAKGVNIGDAAKEEWTRPAELKILKSGRVSEVKLCIQEGKFHQVKRMFRSQGMEVLYLRRDAFGPLTLDEALKFGECRPLTKKELEQLL